MKLGKWYKLQGTNVAYPYQYYSKKIEDAVWVIYQSVSKTKWGKTVTTNTEAIETERPEDLYPFFEIIFKTGHY